MTAQLVWAFDRSPLDLEWDAAHFRFHSNGDFIARLLSGRPAVPGQLWERLAEHA